MTPEEAIARANRARDFLADPLVKEAFEVLERDIVEAIFACPTRDLEGLRILQTDLRLTRQFKGFFQGAVERGKLAAQDLLEREQSLAQRAANSLRRVF